MPNVLNCQNVSDCGLTSWDLLFCICNGGGCIPALGRDPSNGNPSSAFGYFDLGLPNADTVAGLLGVYSTTATTVTTLANPLSSLTPLGSWQNLSNVLTADGTYASITGTPPNSGSCPIVSDYIQVTGWQGLNIPVGSKIWGIGVGAKGHFSPASHNATFGNFALMLNGVPYWFFDPRAINAICAGVPTAPASPYGLSFPWSQEPGASGNTMGTFDIHFNPLDNVAAIPENIAVGDQALGTMPGCTGNGQSWQGVYGPLFKGFFSQLKQSWLASEVNDPSFGFAVNWGLLPGSGLSTLLIDCFGIAIYYTAGVVVPNRRQPNVCINT